MRTGRILLVTGLVVLAAWCGATKAAAALIRGTVTDTLSGAGVLRATVLVKGTTNQALTDAQGKFSLTVTVGLEDERYFAAPERVFRYNAAGRTIFWDNGQPALVQVYAADGAAVVRQTGAGHCVLPGLADGVYLLEVTLDGKRARGKVLMVDHAVTVSFADPPLPAAKSAADVTLVYSRTGYVAKELAATAGDTAVVAKLRTTYPATPAEIGPSNPAALQPSGSITVTSGTRVIENVLITDGQITIYGGTNITIRNFKIVNPGYWGILVDGGSNVVIEDGEIYGGVSDGISGSNYTARRVYIHNMGADAFKAMGDCRIERCYAVDLGESVGAHSDGVQGPWAAGTYGPVQIVNNNFLLDNLDNACDFACDYLPAVLTEGNRFNGGSYSVYCSSNHTVINNVFGRGYSYNIRTDGCGTWSGNIWFDTALPAQ
jgi:hypothetical protein